MEEITEILRSENGRIKNILIRHKCTIYDNNIINKLMVVYYRYRHFLSVANVDVNDIIFFEKFLYVNTMGIKTINLLFDKDDDDESYFNYESIMINSANEINHSNLFKKFIDETFLILCNINHINKKNEFYTPNVKTFIELYVDWELFGENYDYDDLINMESNSYTDELYYFMFNRPIHIKNNKLVYFIELENMPINVFYFTINKMVDLNRYKYQIIDSFNLYVSSSNDNDFDYMYDYILEDISTKISFDENYVIYILKNNSIYTEDILKKCNYNYLQIKYFKYLVENLEEYDDNNRYYDTIFKDYMNLIYDDMFPKGTIQTYEIIKEKLPSYLLKHHLKYFFDRIINSLNTKDNGRKFFLIYSYYRYNIGELITLDYTDNNHRLISDILLNNDLEWTHRNDFIVQKNISVDNINNVTNLIFYFNVIMEYKNYKNFEIFFDIMRSKFNSTSIAFIFINNISFYMNDQELYFQFLSLFKGHYSLNWEIVKAILKYYNIDDNVFHYNIIKSLKYNYEYKKDISKLITYNSYITKLIYNDDIENVQYVINSIFIHMKDLNFFFPYELYEDLHNEKVLYYLSKNNIYNNCPELLNIIQKYKTYLSSQLNNTFKIDIMENNYHDINDTTKYTISESEEEEDDDYNYYNNLQDLFSGEDDVFDKNNLEHYKKLKNLVLSEGVKGANLISGTISVKNFLYDIPIDGDGSYKDNIVIIENTKDSFNLCMKKIRLTNRESIKKSIDSGGSAFLYLCKMAYSYGYNPSYNDISSKTVYSFQNPLEILYEFSYLLKLRDIIDVIVNSNEKIFVLNNTPDRCISISNVDFVRFNNMNIVSGKHCGVNDEMFLYDLVSISDPFRELTPVEKFYYPLYTPNNIANNNISLPKNVLFRDALLKNIIEIDILLKGIMLDDIQVSIGEIQILLDLKLENKNINLVYDSVYQENYNNSIKDLINKKKNKLLIESKKFTREILINLVKLTLYTNDEYLLFDINNNLYLYNIISILKSIHSEDIDIIINSSINYNDDIDVDKLLVEYIKMKKIPEDKLLSYINSLILMNNNYIDDLIIDVMRNYSYYENIEHIVFLLFNSISFNEKTFKKLACENLFNMMMRSGYLTKDIINQSLSFFINFYIENYEVLYEIIKIGVNIKEEIIINGHTTTILEYITESKDLNEKINMLYEILILCVDNMGNNRTPTRRFSTVNETIDELSPISPNIGVGISPVAFNGFGSFHNSPNSHLNNSYDLELSRRDSIRRNERESREDNQRSRGQSLFSDVNNSLPQFDRGLTDYRENNQRSRGQSLFSNVDNSPPQFNRGLINTFTDYSDDEYYSDDEDDDRINQLTNNSSNIMIDSEDEEEEKEESININRRLMFDDSIDNSSVIMDESIEDEEKEETINRRLMFDYSIDNIIEEKEDFVIEPISYPNTINNINNTNNIDNINNIVHGEGEDDDEDEDIVQHTTI